MTAEVVPLFVLAVMVIVGLSPALTKVKPDLVMAPEVKVSEASAGFVGLAPEGALVALQVQTTDWLPV